MLYSSLSGGALSRQYGDRHGNTRRMERSDHDKERCPECGLWKFKLVSCRHCLTRPNREQAHVAAVKAAMRPPTPPMRPVSAGSAHARLPENQRPSMQANIGILDVTLRRMQAESKLYTASLERAEASVTTPAAAAAATASELYVPPRVAPSVARASMTNPALYSSSSARQLLISSGPISSASVRRTPAKWTPPPGGPHDTHLSRAPLSNAHRSQVQDATTTPAVEKDTMSYKLEATLNRAFDQVLMEQVADPLPRLLEVLQSDVPPHVSLAGIQKQLEHLKAQLKASTPPKRARGVTELRACITAAQGVIDQARAGIDECVQLGVAGESRTDDINQYRVLK